MTRSGYRGRATRARTPRTPDPRLRPARARARASGWAPYRQSRVDLLPPLAPPLVSDEDPQLGVPAVRDGLVGVQIEQAVGALLVAVRPAFEHCIFREVLELKRELLVDLFGLGLGQLVVGHAGEA